MSKVKGFDQTMKTDKKKFIKDILWLTFGTLLMSVGVHLFKIPNHFSTGGMSGLSIIIGYLLGKNDVSFITTANLILIFNVIFVIAGFIFVGKSFGWKTVYCSFLFSGAIQLLDIVFPMNSPLTDQRMLELLCATAFQSVGAAVVFKYGGSTGGTDIIAMILKKYLKSDISVSLVIADALIAFSAIFLIDVETGLYSVLGMMLKSFFVQGAIGFINRRKTLLVITSKPDEIIEFITNKLHRSATLWHAAGAFTEEDRTILFAAMTQYQAAELRNYAKKIDEHAFVTVINSSEIYGKGFMNFSDEL
ncbi:MAG: YitT family protein [Clostridia bacterium]|nr:YitT family protein [Clostridia bacterium]